MAKNLYPNLSAEMARSNPKLTNKIISDGIEMPYSTLCEKLTIENRLRYDEAELIKNIYFPQLTVDYLFSSLQENAVAN